MLVNVIHYRASTKIIDGGIQTYKTEIEETVQIIIEQENTIKDMVDRKVESLKVRRRGLWKGREYIWN
jgi:hypothetical protein